MSEAFILPRRRRRIRPYLDLTAMIDTVFNLLIFFAVASSFVGARAGIDLRLPSAKVPYEELVAALDEVRLAKYHRIALAAKAKMEETPTR
jgi:biopolymer transport protein ExbD